MIKYGHKIVYFFKTHLSEPVVKHFRSKRLLKHKHATVRLTHKTEIIQTSKYMSITYIHKLISDNFIHDAYKIMYIYCLNHVLALNYTVVSSIEWEFGDKNSYNPD